MSLRFGLAEEAGLDPVALGAVEASLAASIAEEAFPGAVALVARHGVIAGHWALGLRRVSPPAAMTHDVVFDLASLTKAVCTAPVVLRLAAEARLDLAAPIGEVLPWTRSHFVARRTSLDLLTHRAGLPPSADIAWASEPAERHRMLLAAAGERPLEGSVYSDIGYYLLGLVAEAVAGEDLGRLFARWVARPVGMERSGFGPFRDADAPLAATELVDGRPLEGVVHDGKARLMGVPVGHAGLFAPALDVALYAQCLLDGGRGRLGDILPGEYVRRMLAPATDDRRDVRSLGLFYWGERDAGGRPLDLWGHTGFTGTSFAVSPAEGLVAVLLTNRVHPYRRPESALRAARQRFHEAVLASLG